MVIFEDDFESYSPGDKLAETAANDFWTTWSNDPGSAEDATISDNFAASGSNSALISTGNDVVLLLGDSTSGMYDVEAKVYIPSDSIGYYNFQHDFGNEWAFQMYFDTNGYFRMDAGTADTITSTYNHDEWITTKTFIDIDNDWTKFYMNGELLLEWPWTYTSFGTSGTNVLDCANFYAWSDNGPPAMYMDDIIYRTADPISVERLDRGANIQLYPNPASDMLKITADENIKHLSLMNSSGQVIYNTSIDGDHLELDISNYATGVYFVRLITEGQISIKKLIIE